MALGVAFGLACSLMLKHSRLSIYPQLESCLVALIAYTSYFFSNAVTMSGIVSLLFCGITLKHYAYHNMSRRTQRATKYTFQTLASLSENFIFIYLGLSLFTQEGLVFKPLFIVVTVAAVVFSRYVAVFPIASLINLLRRIRSQRSARRTGGGGLPRTGREEQLSREYQIMLFWAGLRGAVGFALSAGITGQNAVALQTTVLVTIVLTLLVFGGTTAQMLDILGIRTGVQDDEGDSSDEEDADVGMARIRGGAGRRGNTSASGLPANRRAYRDDYSYEDDQDQGSAFVPKSRNGHHYSYDDERSSESSDVLPSSSSRSAAAATIGVGGTGDVYPVDAPFSGSSKAAGGARALLERGALIMRDGQWFQRIDDRESKKRKIEYDVLTFCFANADLVLPSFLCAVGYLKPYFSNAVASRKAEERKSQRIASRSNLADTLVQGGHDVWATSPQGEPSTPSANEPDADIFSLPDDDDEDDYHHLVSADALPPSSSSNSGRATPRIRSGDNDGNGTTSSGHSRRMGSSTGVGGAFA